MMAPVQKALTGWSTRQIDLPPVKDVLLVAIDEASIEALGAWPWPRELHARLVDRLTEGQARAVAYAVPWTGAEPRDALNQLSRLAEAVAADPALAEHTELTGWVQQSQVLLDGDSRLAQSLAQNRRTVLAVGPAASSPEGGWPLAALASASAGIGHLDLPVNASDGVIDALPLLQQRGDRWLPALSLAAVATWLQVPMSTLQWQQAGGDRVALLGSHRWPTDAAGRIEPLWAQNERHFDIPQWPAAALLAGQLPPAGLKDRLVVVGLQVPEASAAWRPTAGGDRSTAFIVAAAAHALLHDSLLAHPAWGRLVAAALVLVSGAYLLLIVPLLHPRSRIAITTLWIAVMLVTGHLAVVAWHTEVPMALPISALFAGHLAFEWTRRSAATAPIAPTRSPVVPASMAPTMPAPLAQLGAMQQPPARRILDEFEVLEEIGRGAMGRVHRARQTSTGAIVALKTMALGREFDGFALQEAQQRFQREALAAGRLQHPDIVKTLATGESQGLVWIAMELLDGHDLVRHTTDGQLLPVPVVLEICARIASALAHAHRHGVVHRDIKPANVMVQLDPAHRRRPTVKVTDFGIARITDAARTRTGLVLGSPSYMSPEHLAGRAVDGRSDLYSLGVLLFQLLTGQLPFQGSTVAELMHAVANVPAPDVRALRPRLPEAVANLVALALEKRPELRYADGLQMAEDLRSVAAMWPAAWPPGEALPREPAPSRTSTTV